jgi:RimJ/RimL family protein N-acetyltransferase
MTGHVLTLRPLTKAGAYEIEHWFDQPEVRHRLGDRFWIHRAVRLLREAEQAKPGEMFRGKKVLRSYGWLADDADGTPVAHIGGEVYDRWVRYHGEGKPTDGEIRAVTMGLGYVVDPARWRRGYGRAAIEAVLAHPDLADVELWTCGIDADNIASQRCAESAGFHLADPAPDFEGMLYYQRKTLT